VIARHPEKGPHVREGVTFVHAADLHLDAPFQGIGVQDARVGAELADATYRAFAAVVDTCLERKVDFLVIAGDAYNSADKSLRAQLRFRHEMERLAEAGIEAFVVHGNHDPASGWSAMLSLPETVRIFPADRVERFEVRRDGELIAAVYGRSFGKAAETGNFARGYVREAGDPLTIGVLHANVGGNPDHDPYAPASLEDLRAVGMDYWALGHIHKQEVLARDPWAVYAGSPQGLNPKETGPHGCLVVRIDHQGGVEAEHVECAPVAWARQGVDLVAASDLDEVRRLLGDACESLRAREGRALVVRLTLEGRSGVHAQLSRPGVVEELLEDLRLEQAPTDPWVWIDRLDDRTSPEIDLEQVRGGRDFAAEMLRIADELAADERALDGLVESVADPVASTLTGYVPSAEADAILRQARDLALGLLLAEDGESR
jgi:DNA repair exonuclease SbcCD nuclease subunit